MTKLLLVLLLTNLVSVPIVYGGIGDLEVLGNALVHGDVEIRGALTSNEVSANTNNIILHDNSLLTNSNNITSNATEISTNTSDIETNRLKNVEQDTQLDNHDKRISELEETQINLVGEVNLIQGRRHKISVYGKYDARHNRVPEVGLKVTFDLDESWSVKEIDKINNKLDLMNQQLNQPEIKTEKIKISDKKCRFQISDKALKIIKKW